MINYFLKVKGFVGCALVSSDTRHRIIYPCCVLFNRSEIILAPAKNDLCVSPLPCTTIIHAGTHPPRDYPLRWLVYAPRRKLTPAKEWEKKREAPEGLDVTYTFGVNMSRYRFNSLKKPVMQCASAKRGWRRGDCCPTYIYFSFSEPRLYKK